MRKVLYNILIQPALKDIKIRICKSTMLPVALCENRHRHRLRMFENRVLKRIFGPERD
jgi:hypothetical protein